LFERLSERSNTKIEISDVDYDADTITLTNNGSVILDLLELDLLLNGTPSNDAVSSMVVEGDSGTNLWAPSEELVINLSVDIVHRGRGRGCGPGGGLHGDNLLHVRGC
jgi:archaellum component FlaF (FlaF/FlaG flagellin family)